MSLHDFLWSDVHKFLKTFTASGGRGGVCDRRGDWRRGGCDCRGEWRWGDGDRRRGDRLLGPGWGVYWSYRVRGACFPYWGEVSRCRFVPRDDVLEEWSSHEGGSKCLATLCWSGAGSSVVESPCAGRIVGDWVSSVSPTLSRYWRFAACGLGTPPRSRMIESSDIASSASSSRSRSRHCRWARVSRLFFFFSCRPT